MKIQEIILKCKARIDSGADRNSLISYLHNEGLSIIEAIKVLKYVYGISLGEAKALVTTHPAWSEEIKNADILHNELLQEENSN